MAETIFTPAFITGIITGIIALGILRLAYVEAKRRTKIKIRKIKKSFGPQTHRVIKPSERGRVLNTLPWEARKG